MNTKKGLANELRNLLDNMSADDNGHRDRLVALIEEHQLGYVALTDLRDAVGTELLRLGIPAGGTDFQPSTLPRRPTLARLVSGVPMG